MKTRVAVFLGGRSPEHDVSVVTGLQALQALDQSRFDAFVLYVTPQGDWLTGPGLDDRRNYLPDSAFRAKLTEVTLDLAAGTGGRLVPRKSGLFSRRPPIEFDVALLAFHGLGGEDGQFQGLFEAANIAYTGMRTLASSVLMDKAATKRMLAGAAIPLLPDAVIDRPEAGLPATATLEPRLAPIGFPCCVKPAHLGSSIGVGKAENVEEVRALLAAIFRLDTQAVIEPFVPNLVEYNVSVARFGETPRCSAIEQPKRVEALLDFRQKYLSGGDGANKAGGKNLGRPSEGMLSLTRDINPVLPGQQAPDIRRWAIAAFEAVGGTGAPRIDFLCNGATGDIWLNEINPCPGSFGFFLWEAAEEPIGFTALLSHLIDEAQARHRATQLPDDPVPPDARLLKRP
ncbi:MAG: D-alanine--D-alanine ligase [Alphaproteobacteria bacterium]|nr:D-alanine--D-alanine ligase [Alphaproteobacteria bacterium]